MKHIASILSVVILGVSLLNCSGGGGGGNNPAFAVSTTSATYGVVGNAYSSTLAATGGTAPFTWTVSGGVLPVGLTLNAATGVVAGTPAAPAGNVTTTFTVSDSMGKTAIGSVLFAVHDRTDRVSVDSNGAAGNGASASPSLNGDGSLVAFVSLSTNFVTGVSGSQIYVHNRQNNQAEVVSRDGNSSVVNEGNGASSAPSISADGRYVAFVSQATNLLAPGTPAIPAGQQVYVRDRQTGLTSLVSIDNNVTPNPGNGVSSAPTMSADGRYVAFVSLATNLLAPGTPAIPAGQQVYVRDRQTGLTSLVSIDNNVTPNPGNGVSSAPAMSADGRYVGFASQATNLLAPGTPAMPAGQQVYLRDRQTGLTSLVSVDNNVTPNPGNGFSSAPSLSGDGRYVGFVSLATNLLAPGVPAVAGTQIYIRDRQLGQSLLASQDNTNLNIAGTGGVSDTPSINSSGGFVAFFSQATNLVTAPPAASSNVYVRATP